MTFQAEKIAEFLSNFDQNKSRIRQFNGCEHLELLQEKGRPEVYFTYSWWCSESDLRHYRQSELFRGIWQKTRTFFSAPPEAWSLENKVTVEQ